MKNKKLPDTCLQAIINNDKDRARKMMDKHIRDDEQSRSEFEEYLDLWEKSADAAAFAKIDPDRDWQKVRARIKLKGRQRRIPAHKYVLRIASVLILAMGLAYLFTAITGKVAQHTADYIESSATEANTRIELPDGSMIFLNKNAKLIRNSDFGSANRDVILEGEAFFEVARNEDLPFKVHTGNTIVEVLGTSFHVNSGPGEIKVGVVSGRVAFYSQKDQSSRIELKPEESGVYSANDNQLNRKTYDRNTLIWHTGEYSFDNEMIGEICQTIASHFNIKYVQSPHSANLEEERINVYVSALSLSTAIQNINEVLKDGKVVIRNNEISIEQLN